MAENLTEIEFNSMVDVLKRLSRITDNINDSRRKKDVETLYEDLKAYYYEIMVDMSVDELSGSKKILKLIKTHVRSPAGVIARKSFLLDKLEDLEEILRKAAKRAGYLTKNIKKQNMKII